MGRYISICICRSFGTAFLLWPGLIYPPYNNTVAYINKPIEVLYIFFPPSHQCTVSFLKCIKQQSTVFCLFIHFAMDMLQLLSQNRK